MKHTRRTVLGMTFALLSRPGFARADAYPERPVKIVVPYPAGGYYDRVARILGAALRAPLKQTFIVDNKVGANGVIAAAHVASSPPDGYTLLLAGIGPNAISPALTTSLQYDPIQSFAPISLLVSAPNVLVVPATSPIQNFAEFVALAKRSAGAPLNYAHNGVGSSVHLAMELLKGRLGIQLTAIPYKGSAPAVQAVTSGEVSIAFASVLDVLPLIEAGRLRALAVGGTERIAAIRDVKTVAEQGVPGFDSTAWSGLCAPSGTPADIVAKLNQAVNIVLKEPKVVKQLSPGGELQILGGSSEHFGSYIRSEIAKWTQVVKDNGIKAE